MMYEILQDWFDFCQEKKSFDKSHFFSLFTYPFSRSEVEKIFSYFPSNEKLVDRLIEVKNFGDLTNRPYLVPFKNNTLETKDAFNLVAADLAEKRKFCVLKKDEELIDIIDRVEYQVCNDPKKISELFHLDTPNMWLFELIGDFIRKKTPKNTKYFALAEALYGLSANYYLSWYILEPLLSLENISFQAYFELWKSGVDYCLTEALVYVVME